MYEAQGIDAASLATWDDLVGAGQQLTVMDGETMSVAGLSPVSSALSMVKNWVWQVGGEFYNGETGEWTFSTPEGEASLQRLHDLFHGEQPTCSFDLVSLDNEFDVWKQGKIATHMNGAWTIGVPRRRSKADGIPTPMLAEMADDVVYPEHIGGHDPVTAPGG